MPRSVEKLIEAAQQCFFQHGYSAANVSLIGRYAGISRATIYKNFSSKDALLRAVIQNHIDQNQPALKQYQASTGNFWDDTEQLIKGRCQGVFDDISSNIIRSELIHVAKTLCQDLVQNEKRKVQKLIASRLEQDIANKLLSTEAIGLSIKDFAQVIESVPLGIAFSSMEDNNLDLITNMFAVFRASTK